MQQIVKLLLSRIAMNYPHEFHSLYIRVIRVIRVEVSQVQTTNDTNLTLVFIACFILVIRVITPIHAGEEDGVGLFRSLFTTSSFCLRSSFVYPTLILRSAYVHPPLCLRFVNEGRSSSQRRMIEFTTKDERRMNGGIWRCNYMGMGKYAKICFICLFVTLSV